MPKRRIMRTFKLSEISGVDQPAQAGARMVLMKSQEKLVFKFNGQDYESAEDLQKAVEAYEKGVEDHSHALKVAKAYGELSDREKTYAKGLKDDEREAFVLSAPQIREEAVAKSEEKDRVVYKAADGTEFRASDDSRLVEMAKRADASAKALEEIQKREAQATFEKRAEKELQYLPGSVEVRAELLKQAESIADPTLREGALAALKAQNDAMSKAFDSHGTTSTPSGDAEQEIAKLAKAYQEAHPELSMPQAWAKVTESGRGAELAEQARQ